MADEADRDFDEWLAAVNDDINAALGEHLLTTPTSTSRKQQPPTRANPGASAAGEGQSSDAVVRRGEGGSASPAEASGALRSARPLLSGDVDLSDMAFLTVAEAAGVMRVSKMTIYRMVHSGELFAVRVGRSFRVPAKAMREYLSTAYVESSAATVTPHEAWTDSPSDS